GTAPAPGAGRGFCQSGVGMIVMNALKRLWILSAFWIIAMSAPPLSAQESRAIQVSAGVSYELIGRWDVDRLNRILQSDPPAFANLQVTYSPARNAVRLYRVT